MGKTRLIESVQQQGSRKPDLDKSRFITGPCYEHTYLAEVADL